jgi:RNA polymerase sigma-70 factor (ECF subfamily)
VDAAVTTLALPLFSTPAAGRPKAEAQPVTATPRRALDAADRALIEGCRSGRRDAQRALYDRYRRLVYGVALRMVGPVDAEELLQDVFLRVFRNLGSFRGDSALATWIYRLTVNASLSHLSRRPPPTVELGGIAEALPGEEPPAADPLAARMLERAISLLPPGYRAVLVLHDVEGLSHEEIGEILGCEVGTSKSQLHKARARLRAAIGGVHPSESGGDRGGGGQP